jgi:hypothetical protein
MGTQACGRKELQREIFHHERREVRRQAIGHETLTLYEQNRCSQPAHSASLQKSFKGTTRKRRGIVNDQR